ncbi:MAG: hypothetical protein WC551_12195 [Patescibacteria group bacterium]
MVRDNISACRRPFSADDLNALDKVVDGRLYNSELEEGDLDCLVEHLIRTKDSNLRDDFRFFIQNDLWEAIRNRLLELKNRGGFDNEISERIDDLLTKEYSDDEIFVSTYVSYKLNSQRNDITTDGQSENYNFDVHSLALNGSFEGQFNIKTWKLLPKLSLLGEQFWTDGRSAPAGGTPQSSNDSYQGGGGQLSVSLLRRDEAFKLDGNGYFYKYSDPPPSRTEGSYGAQGSLQFHDIGDSAFSLKASANWYLLDITPLNDMYFDPAHEALEVDAEAAYMFSSTGVLATYEFNDYDTVDSVYASKQLNHSGSLLAHFDVGKSYLRAGAGGGYWEEESRQPEGTPSASQGGEIHAKFLGDFEMNEALHLNFSVKAAANQSDGTFVGWYPSGSLSLGGSLMLGDISINVSGWASGDYRETNLSQKNLSYGTDGKVIYSPTDYFNTSILGGYNWSRQYLYDALQSNYWYSNAVLAFRVNKALNMWIIAEGNLAGLKYDTEAGHKQETTDFTLLGKFSLKY